MDTLDIQAISGASFVFSRGLSQWAALYELGDAVFRAFMREQVGDAAVWYSWASDGSAPGTINYTENPATGYFSFSGQPTTGDQLQIGTSLVPFVSAPSAVTIAPSAVVTISVATIGLVSWVGHKLPIGAPVVFTLSAGGTLYTGLTAGTTYYVSSTSYGADSFAVATSYANAIAGSTVTTTGTSSGVITCTAPTIVIWPSHGLSAGAAVRFQTTGSLAPPLVADPTIYYVLAALITADAFQIGATAGGSPISASGAGSGTSTALAGNQALIGSTLAATLANLLTTLSASTDSQVSQCTYSVAADEIFVAFKATGVAGNGFAFGVLVGTVETASAASLGGGGGIITFENGKASDSAGFAGESFYYDCRIEFPGGAPNASPIYLFGGQIVWLQAVTRT